MARKPRIHIPGGVYHVMLRGNAGQDIFFEDQDRYHLYLLIQEGVERFGHRIHGFCCMDNHLHLVVQVADEPLSRIMQNLGFRYTRWINDNYERSGHLFQGRYKALLVDADSYLLELIRYVHLNPVRAGLTEDPAAYPWSGHRAYLGMEVLPWLETDWVLSQFDKQLSTARKHYASFVRDGVAEGYRPEFHQGLSEDSRILADDDFRSRVLGKDTPSRFDIDLQAIIRHVSNKMGISETDLRAPGRNRHAARARAVIGYLARRLETASLTDVASHFQRDLSTLSRQVAELEKLAVSSEETRDELAQYVTDITK